MALRLKLENDRRLEALSAFVHAYEKEYGEITPEEMSLASRRVRANAVAVRSGLPPKLTAKKQRRKTRWLDASAFVAVERNDRDTLALIKQELVAKRVPITHGGVIGEV
jgi:hypothetical protein